MQGGDMGVLATGFHSLLVLFGSVLALPNHIMGCCSAHLHLRLTRSNYIQVMMATPAENLASNGQSLSLH